MRIVDLAQEHEATYFACLEEWSEEMREAGPHKEAWYHRLSGRGLRVKMAQSDDGVIAGMIQYVPAEHAPIEGTDLNFVLCIWVHGYKRGIGNYQRRGMGKALLAAAAEDTRLQGRSGLAAWGLALPFFMRASWFKKRGYTPVDRQGVRVLLWKPFVEGAPSPRWIRRRKTPGETPGQVTVTAFMSGWCPAQNIVYERARRACEELGERAVFKPVHTYDREVFLEWGISDGLFIDGREMRTGPPPSYEKIRKAIERGLRRVS